MRIITVLGTGKYDPVKYSWLENICETSLFPVALVEWLKPTDVHVLLTEKAKENDNWRSLQDALKEKISLHAVDIPNGATEKELWEIFDSVAKIAAASPNDKFAIDITHGFRSTPILTLLSAAFLRSARGLNLTHIFYGAFEAKDTQTKIVPVFDLTLFLELLDWSAAAERFNDTGDSSKIASLLNESNRQFYLTRSNNKEADRPVYLQKIAKTMENISGALSLTLPREVLPESKTLIDMLNAAKNETRFAPPFGVVFDNLKKGYQAIAVDMHLAKPKEILSGEWRLVQWYHQRRQWAPMITLAREWIVSAVCVQNGSDPNEFNSRKQAEEHLNKVISNQRKISEKAQRAWDGVSQFRNQIAHCGMQKQHISSDSLQKNIEKTMKCLAALAKENGMDA